MKNLTIKKEDVKYFLLFLYFISFSAHRLGTGFDAIFVRTIFVIIVFASILWNKKIIFSKVFIWNAVFWLYYYISMLWAKNPSDTLSNVAVSIQILGLCFVVPSYIKDIESFNKVIKILFYALIYTSILLIIKTPLITYGTERIGGALGLNSNILGIRMATGAIISIYLYHNSQNKKKCYLIFLVLFSGLALLSGSRKALALLVLGVTVYELFFDNRNFLLKLAKMLVLVIGIGLLIFNNQKLYNVLGYRVERMVLTIIGKDTVDSTDRSYIERAFFREKAMELFSNHILLGYGGGNFKTYMSEINYRRQGYSHCNYTELLSTLGVIGFLIYYSIWIYTIYNLYKIFRRKKEMRNISLFLLIILCLYLILDYGLVSFDNEYYALTISVSSVYVGLVIPKNRKEEKIMEKINV